MYRKPDTMHSKRASTPPTNWRSRDVTTYSTSARCLCSWTVFCSITLNNCFCFPFCGTDASNHVFVLVQFQRLSTSPGESAVSDVSVLISRRFFHMRRVQEKTQDEHGFLFFFPSFGVCVCNANAPVSVCVLYNNSLRVTHLSYNKQSNYHIYGTCAN